MTAGPSRSSWYAIRVPSNDVKLFMPVPPDVPSSHRRPHAPREVYDFPSSVALLTISPNGAHDMVCGPGSRPPRSYGRSLEELAGHAHRPLAHGVPQTVEEPRVRPLHSLGALVPAQTMSCAQSTPQTGDALRVGRGARIMRACARCPTRPPSTLHAVRNSHPRRP